MKPGIHHDVPAHVYYGIDALSNSIAKIGLSRSWYHARQAMLGEFRVESEKFDIGTAAHALLLEGSSAKICVVEADDWRTKAAKEQRDQAREAGMTPILAKHNAALQLMVTAAREFIAQTEFASIFQNGAPEVTIVWDEDGLLCKARTDWLTHDRRVIIDYKTTENAAPEAFGKSIAKYGYDFQSSWYSRGVSAAAGIDPAFILFAQESEYPYRCSLHGLSNTYNEIAEAKCERALAEYRACKQADKWPAYPTRVCYQEPPTWAINEHMAAMEAEA